MLKELTQTRANRLTRMMLPDIKEPIGVRILWIHVGNVRTVSRLSHKHSFFEAHFLFEGKMEYEVKEGRCYSLCNVGALILPPETAHTVAYISEDAVKISIAFMPIEENGAYMRSLQAMGAYCFLPSVGAAADFDVILSEAERRSAHSPYLIRDRVFSVLSPYFQAADTQPSLPPSQSTEDYRIAMVRRYVCDNPHLFLTCEDVAQSCHFNTKYLGRLFREKTGMTLLEYIHSQKIAEAEQLLSKGVSCQEIAERLGFANEYYFNSFFKRESGLSPGNYQRLLKK